MSAGTAPRVPTPGRRRRRPGEDLQGRGRAPDTGQSAARQAATERSMSVGTGRDEAATRSPSTLYTTPHDVMSSESSAESDSESVSSMRHNTAEVIVQGDNVRKIRVKFPPTASSDDVSRSGSAQKRVPRPPSRLGKSRIHEHVPFSTEESSPETVVAHGAEPWSMTEMEQEATDNALRTSQDSAFTSAGSTAGLDMDVKFKQDMLHSIEYFDRRNADLKKTNNTIVRENERMREMNKHLQNVIDDMTSRYERLSSENDELKQKLDKLEKESTISKDDAVTSWQSKVKAEELYVEKVRDSKKEIEALREALDASERARQAEPPHTAVLRDSKEDLAERLELVHRIEQLEDELRQVKNNNELANKQNEFLDEQLKELQSKLSHKSRELEAQYKRFLSLKKSFNDLLETNKTLKAQLKERKEVGNITWPPNKPRAATLPRQDKISLIDLTARTKPALPKVDTRVTLTGPAKSRLESLPPVPGSSKQ